MNYTEAIDWLYATQGIGIKLGLENIRRLLKAFDLPCYPETPSAAPIVHLAGTNGKGSVCAMLDAICRAAGVRTGLFTSPHLVTYRERIRLNGEMIPEEDAARWLTRLRDEVAEWEPQPTFFELTTALAMAWFKEQGAEVIIIETGLGGRLDSSNALPPALTLLTPISLDHQQYLGETLAMVATEKAGIIKPGVPVISSLQPASAAHVISETAARVGAPLHWVETPVDLPVRLRGSHQRWNAALAAAGARLPGVFGKRISESAIAEGLRKVAWPGRFQQLHDLDQHGRSREIILDGAHNPAAAERLVMTWRECYGEEPSARPTILFGALRDKDVEAILAQLAPLARRFLFTPVRNPRSLSPEELVAMAQRNAPGARCALFGSLEEALDAFEAKEPGERLLITGSLFLVGDALASLEHAKRDPVSAQ